MSYFSDKIRELRKSKKMTQTELGELIGLTKTGISYWESDKAFPPLETLIQLSGIFDVSIEELTGDDRYVGWGKSEIRKADEMLRSEIALGRSGGFDPSNYIDGYTSKDGGVLYLKRALDLESGNIINKFEYDKRVENELIIKEPENDYYNHVVSIKFLGSASCGTGVMNGDSIGVLDLPKQWIKGSHYDYFLCYASGDSMINSNILDCSLILAKSTNSLENGQIGVFHLNDEEYIKKYQKINDMIILKSTNTNYEDIYVSQDDRFKILGIVEKIITDLNQ